MCSRKSSSDDLDGAADSELTDYEADAAASREAHALAVEEDTGTSSAEQPPRQRTPASERSRYKGDPTLLADALAPYATSRSFVQYDECNNVAKAKIDPQKIKKLHPILNALREIHPKLTFTKRTVEAAISLLVDRLGFGLKPEHKADFISTIAQRLRNALRVVTQAEMKSPNAAWVRELPWRCASDADGAAAPSASSLPSLPAEYTFGFESTEKRAWRLPAGRQQVREYTGGIQAGTHAMDTIVATWPDGMMYEITDVTTQEWEAMLQPRGSHGGTRWPIMWESQHVVTRHRLKIQCKEDRGLLCVLTEQGNQVLQVLVAGFGDGEGETEQKKAARFLEDIAVLYAQDKISKADLYRTRDEMAKERGVAVRRARGGTMRSGRASPNVPAPIGQGVPSDTVRDTTPQPTTTVAGVKRCHKTTKVNAVAEPAVAALQATPASERATAKRDMRRKKVSFNDGLRVEDAAQARSCAADVPAQAPQSSGTTVGGHGLDNGKVGYKCARTEPTFGQRVPEQALEEEMARQGLMNECDADELIRRSL